AATGGVYTGLMVGTRFFLWLSFSLTGGFFLIAGTGCSLFGSISPEKLVGTWSLEMTFTDAYKQTPEYKSQEPALKYFVDTARMDLRSDRTFFQNTPLFQVEGQWEIKEGVLHLYPAKINGIPVEDLQKRVSQKEAAEMSKPGRFRISPDATRLEPLEEDVKVPNPGVKIVWKKK
ncbi:MAG: hypothetical protein K6T17_09115, partial [Fimbriimonadales bacterium]|nr:hypothetical protein [Fimbriimonadales bacterium]